MLARSLLLRRAMKQHGITLFVVAASLVPALAVGGMKTSEQVSITTVSSDKLRVHGSLSGARNSADSVQYIGCKIRYDFGYCWGRDASGRTAQCSSSQVGIMAAMRAVTAASYLDFTIQAGTCTNLEVATSSRWIAPVNSELGAQP